MAVILTISAKAGDAETSAVPIVSAATSRVKTWVRIAFSLFVSGASNDKTRKSAQLTSRTPAGSCTQEKGAVARPFRSREITGPYWIALSVMAVV
jgi:hypothetical protein